jgi:hypothetical protein
MGIFMSFILPKVKRRRNLLLGNQINSEKSIILLEILLRILLKKRGIDLMHMLSKPGTPNKTKVDGNRRSSMLVIQRTTE